MSEWAGLEAVEEAARARSPSLKLTDRRLRPRDAASLGASLVRCTALTSVDLSSSKAGGAFTNTLGPGRVQVEAVANAVAALPMLTELYLSGLSLGDVGASVLGDALVKSAAASRLRVLAVERNGLTAAGVAAVIALPGAGAEEDFASPSPAMRASSLRSRPAGPQRQSSSRAESGPPFGRLNALLLGGNSVAASDGGGSAIGDAVAALTSLTYIDLSGNGAFGDDGVRGLAEGIARRGKSLPPISVSVAGCGVGGGGGAVATVGVASLARCLDMVSSLNAGGNAGIGPEDAEALAASIAALPQPRSLAAIDLSETGIGDRGIAAVADALASLSPAPGHDEPHGAVDTRVSLAVRRCGGGENGASSAAACIRAGVLGVLDMSHNRIGEAAALSLAEACTAAGSRAPRVLRLRNVNAGAEAARAVALASVAPGCAVSVLDVAGNGAAPSLHADISRATASSGEDAATGAHSALLVWDVGSGSTFAQGNKSALAELERKLCSGEEDGEPGRAAADHRDRTTPGTAPPGTAPARTLGWIAAMRVLDAVARGGLGEGGVCAGTAGDVARAVDAFQPGDAGRDSVPSGGHAEPAAVGSAELAAFGPTLVSNVIAAAVAGSEAQVPPGSDALRSEVAERLLCAVGRLAVDGCDVPLRAPPFVDLSGLGLRSVPVWLARCGIRALDLRGNAIRDLDAGFFDPVGGLRWIDLRGNPIVDEVPAEFRGDHESAVAYLRDRMTSGETTLMHMRVILVGPRAAGKSTTLACLQEAAAGKVPEEPGTPFRRRKWNPAPPAVKEPTVGIDIVRLELDVGGHPDAIEGRDTAELHLTVLDFGGDQVYERMHTMFMDQRAVYLFICDLRKVFKPEEMRARHWLASVRRCAPGARVIMIGTRAREYKKNPVEMHRRLSALYAAFHEHGDGLILSAVVGHDAAKRRVFTFVTEDGTPAPEPRKSAAECEYGTTDVLIKLLSAAGLRCLAGIDPALWRRVPTAYVELAAALERHRDRLPPVVAAEDLAGLLRDVERGGAPGYDDGPDTEEDGAVVGAAAAAADDANTGAAADGRDGSKIDNATPAPAHVRSTESMALAYLDARAAVMLSPASDAVFPDPRWLLSVVYSLLWWKHREEANQGRLPGELDWHREYIKTEGHEAAEIERRLDGGLEAELRALDAGRRAVRGIVSNAVFDKLLGALLAGGRGDDRGTGGSAAMTAASVRETVITTLEEHGVVVRTSGVTTGAPAALEATVGKLTEGSPHAPAATPAEGDQGGSGEAREEFFVVPVLRSAQRTPPCAGPAKYGHWGCLLVEYEVPLYLPALSSIFVSNITLALSLADPALQDVAVDAWRNGLAVWRRGVGDDDLESAKEPLLAAVVTWRDVGNGGVVGACVSRDLCNTLGGVSTVHGAFLLSARTFSARIRTASEGDPPPWTDDALESLVPCTLRCCGCGDAASWTLLQYTKESPERCRMAVDGGECGAFLPAWRSATIASPWTSRGSISGGNIDGGRRGRHLRKETHRQLARAEERAHWAALLVENDEASTATVGAALTAVSSFPWEEGVRSAASLASNIPIFGHIAAIATVAANCKINAAEAREQAEFLLDALDEVAATLVNVSEKDVDAWERKWLERARSGSASRQNSPRKRLWKLCRAVDNAGAALSWWKDLHEDAGIVAWVRRKSSLWSGSALKRLEDCKSQLMAEVTLFAFKQAINQ